MKTIFVLLVFSPLLQATPVCSAGPQQTFISGTVGSLDASASTGSGSLSYAWSQLSGPAVTLSSATAQKPTFTAALPTGTYQASSVFQLVVTDSVPSSATCTVKDGTVTVDAAGAVITGAGPAIDALMGPILPWGKTPWPWYDDRRKKFADRLITYDADNTKYGPFWDTPGTGTVTVTPGSNVITGVGTTFTSTFASCSASSGSGIHPIIFYPLAGGGTGRRMVTIATCTSDTAATLDTTWNIVSGGSGLSYSVDDFLSWWEYSLGPGGFYDSEVTLFYTLYYASGIDDYQIAARANADKMYASPQFDRGLACNPISNWQDCFFGNIIYMSSLGQVLRALDGQPSHWVGLDQLWAAADNASATQTFYNYPGGIYHLRDTGYEVLNLSYCALYAADVSGNPDSTWRTTCAADLIAMLAGSHGFTAALQSDGGMYEFFSGGDGTFSSWYTGGASTAVMTTGSSTAAATGSPWTSAMFTDCTGQGVIGCPIWFTNSPSVQPSFVGGGDSQVYFATYTDPNHLTLHNMAGTVIPYAGTNGTHGWVSGDSESISVVGPTAQPYAEGLLASGFALASKALAASHPNEAALYASYARSLAGWIKTYGYDSTWGGMWQAVGLVECIPPIDHTAALCMAGTQESARFDAGIAIKGLIAAFRTTRDPGMGAFIDALYSQMFGKPGTGGPLSDVNYISDLDDTGYYLIPDGPSRQTNKAAGELLSGIGLQLNWPAVRGYSSTPISNGGRVSSSGRVQ